MKCINIGIMLVFIRLRQYLKNQSYLCKYMFLFCFFTPLAWYFTSVEMEWYPSPYNKPHFYERFSLVVQDRLPAQSARSLSLHTKSKPAQEGQSFNPINTMPGLNHNQHQQHLINVIYNPTFKQNLCWNE